jgi:hypothetical protein
MSRPSSPVGRPIFSGTQLQHRLAVRFLQRLELRLVLLADILRLGLQRVLHPSLGLIDPGLDLRRRKIELSERVAYRGLPLDDFKDQSRLPTRRLALDLFVHLDTHVLSPFGT